MSKKTTHNSNSRGQHKKRRPKNKKASAKGQLFYGLHACIEALKNPDRTIHKIYVTDKIWNGDKRAQTQGISVDLDITALPAPEIVDKAFFDTLFNNHTVHQGIAIDTAPLDEVFLSDLIIKSKTQGTATLVMLDHVTDPHNIGAILRSAAAFGAIGLIGQTRHMPDVTPTTAKIACGGVEHVPIAREKNLSEALEKLKAEGFTCIGLSEHTDKTLADLPKSDKTVIVLGAEGKGMRPKVAETCSVLAKLPTQPPIASLNVSNAAAVALYALR